MPLCSKINGSPVSKWLQLTSDLTVKQYTLVFHILKSSHTKECKLKKIQSIASYKCYACSAYSQIYFIYNNLAFMCQTSLYIFYNHLTSDLLPSLHVRSVNSLSQPAGIFVLVHADTKPVAVCFCVHIRSFYANIALVAQLHPANYSDARKFSPLLTMSAGERCIPGVRWVRFTQT